MRAGLDSDCPKQRVGDEHARGLTVDLSGPAALIKVVQHQVAGLLGSSSDAYGVWSLIFGDGRRERQCPAWLGGSIGVVFDQQHQMQIDAWACDELRRREAWVTRRRERLGSRQNVRPWQR